jgi:hypothetical protein
MQNTFGNESFIDEIAVAAGADPFEFRLKNMKDPRGAELLQALRELAAWKSQGTRSAISGDIARGRGVAYVKYELVRTYVGGVADVEVDMKTGKVRVTKFYVAHDCGQIINPDGLRNQIEGNVVQTVSRTLIEELKFDRSRVTSLDWASYPILKFPDVPDVAIKLMERQSEKPWGRGRADGRHRAGCGCERRVQRDRCARALGAFTPEKVQRRSRLFEYRLPLDFSEQPTKAPSSSVALQALSRARQRFEHTKSARSSVRGHESMHRVCALRQPGPASAACLLALRWLCARLKVP